MRLESTLALPPEALPAVGDKDSRIWRALPRLREPSSVCPLDSMPKVWSTCFPSILFALLILRKFQALEDSPSDVSLFLRLSRASTISPFHPSLAFSSVRPNEHLSSWPPSLPSIFLSFHHPKRNWEQLHPHLTLKIRAAVPLFHQQEYVGYKWDDPLEIRLL